MNNSTPRLTCPECGEQVRPAPVMRHVPSTRYVIEDEAWVERTVCVHVEQAIDVGGHNVVQVQIGSGDDAMFDAVGLSRNAAVTLATAILLLLVGCGGSDNAGPTPTLVIAVSAGDGQSAPVTSGALLSALVTDAAGSPQSGVSVAWSVVSGGGAIPLDPPLRYGRSQIWGRICSG